MALYHENAYVKKFKSKIKEIIKYDKGYGLVLDKTYFYPKSGGQLADRGKIDDIQVRDVFKENNKIIHLVKKKPKNKKVDCLIDWSRRYDFMQQHSGQHLLSAILEDEYKAPTVSFHMSEDYSYIDIRKDSIIEKEIDNIENDVNELIWEDKVVKTYWIEPENISKYDVRKKGKYNDKVRIVEIEDVDLSMCGGTHVSKISEIGILKIIDYEKVKNETIRITFVCGNRALDYFQKINQQLNELSTILSVEKDDIVKMAEKFKNEREKYYNKLEKFKERLVDEKIKKIRTNSEEIIYDTVENLDNNALNYYANQVLKEGKELAIIYDRGNRFLLLKQNSQKYDFKKIGENIKSVYSSKGGGSDTIYQIVNININNLEKEILEEYFK